MWHQCRRSCVEDLRKPSLRACRTSASAAPPRSSIRAGGRGRESAKFTSRILGSVTPRCGVVAAVVWIALDCRAVEAQRAVKTDCRRPVRG